MNYVDDDHDDDVDYDDPFSCNSWIQWENVPCMTYSKNLSCIFMFIYKPMFHNANVYLFLIFSERVVNFPIFFSVPFWYFLFISCLFINLAFQGENKKLSRHRRGTREAQMKHQVGTKHHILGIKCPKLSDQWSRPYQLVVCQVSPCLFLQSTWQYVISRTQTR